MGNPTNKEKAGAISATTFENTNKVKGKDVVFETILVERSYKDKDGKWQTTNNYRVSDLPKLALVAMEAYKKAVLNKKSASSEEDE